ncbi:MAG: phenol hydroxylase [Hydrogenophaga sp.]|uniref:phenol hydroxylase n=1 Tax=Hydrogenophaga sp. TaxID=1904254 RepID=UPI002726DBEC|nr:phenol hydroxylase [Hydrogenophaga sp.]MDO9029580.1 phenol hydroxylase [Hydrogenophaga sp.]
MTVEIRVQSVKPLRHTFAHIAARFGDKPASRYQEGTYHLQSEVNYHYKPLWDPEGELYDQRRTAIQMKDWYALKDPRQYYYGSYTIARARQQEAADRQMEMAGQRGLLTDLPEADRALLVRLLLPLRHVEWGANTNMSQMAAYGWGTAITQAASMGTMDRLGMAQHFSRIGLMLDGNSGRSLAEAKQHWLTDATWQPLRRETENTFVVRDWFETFVAQALIADGLIYPLLLDRFEKQLAQRCGHGLATVLDFPLRWQEEFTRWVDAVIKTCAAESEANRQHIQAWSEKWLNAYAAALQPLAVLAMGEVQGPVALDGVKADLRARLARLKVTA